MPLIVQTLSRREKDALSGPEPIDRTEGAVPSELLAATGGKIEAWPALKPRPAGPASTGFAYAGSGAQHCEPRAASIGA